MSEHLPMLARLLNRGFSVQQARDLLAVETTTSLQLVRLYQTWFKTAEGRERLRKITLSFRELGVEPPFAEIVDVNQLFG